MPDAEYSPWANCTRHMGFTGDSDQEPTWWRSKATATELRNVTGGMSLPGTQDTVACGVFRNTCVCVACHLQAWVGTTHLSGVSRNDVDHDLGC